MIKIDKVNKKIKFVKSRVKNWLAYKNGYDNIVLENNHYLFGYRLTFYPKKAVDKRLKVFYQFVSNEQTKLDKKPNAIDDI